MENSIYPIVQISKTPPTFVQNHLTWKLLPVMEEGIPYYVERNDQTPATEDDFATVDANMRFMISPQYGPEQ